MPNDESEKDYFTQKKSGGFEFYIRILYLFCGNMPLINFAYKKTKWSKNYLFSSLIGMRFCQG
jgi:hypothetical protein